MVLAVALDFRIMGSDAHMRVPEIALGMNMSWQSMPRMLHLMGPARTKQAVLLADDRISAAEAYEWHLVEQVADDGKTFDAAMVMAEKIARLPPMSVAMTKQTINRLTHALDDLASHMDVDQFALASMSEDHKEGVEAFLERRKPQVQGTLIADNKNGENNPMQSRTARARLAICNGRRRPVRARQHDRGTIRKASRCSLAGESHISGADKFTRSLKGETI